MINQENISAVSTNLLLCVIVCYVVRAVVKQTQFNKAHHEVLEESRRNLFDISEFSVFSMVDKSGFVKKLRHDKQTQIAHTLRETLNPKSEILNNEKRSK